MERIWSKAEPGVLLHLIHRSEDFEQERVNLADSNEPLQVASLCLPAGQTFRPSRSGAATPTRCSQTGLGCTR